MSEPTLTTLTEAFLISRQAAGSATQTYIFYQQQLGHFVRSLSESATILDLTPETIESYLAQRRQEVSPRSVHAAWRAIRALCNWLDTRREHYPQWTNPVSRIAAPQLPHTKLPPIERDDLAAMLRACSGHTFYADRDRAVLLVLASSGLRASEFLALNQEDIDLHTGIVRVRCGKGGKSRVTIISPQARLAITDYLGHLVHRDPSQPLWWGRKGPLSHNGLGAILTRRAVEVGVPAPSPHDFRRRWASDMVPKLGPWVVQALGGWAGMEIVEQYVTLSEQDLLDAYKKL